MIQIALCEQASIKICKKPIQNHQSKTVLLFKTYTVEFEFYILSTWLAIRECRVGFPCFLLVNSALSRFLCKNDCLIEPDFPYFSN